MEERLGTNTTAERQFVWGLRYIDDLILRDRSTANNGTMNERRYGMQDGNWNMIAICDTTGAVTERFAYSAYGAPVFMTGAGTVQTSSASGFETLYAGYRWHGDSPLMYYVRNRFLLPVMGTWNRRDPLGYVDGMSSYQNCLSSPLGVIDPLGLDGGATAVVGTLVVTSTPVAPVVVSGTMGTSSVVYITMTAPAAAPAVAPAALGGAGGVATTVAGGAAASAAATVAIGGVRIAGASYGAYHIADPFWHWWYWDPNLEGDPSVATGQTCGPTTGLPIPGGRDPGTPRGRPRQPRKNRPYLR